MIKCENCGAEFEGKFCPKCGTAVAAGTSSEEQPAAEVNEQKKETNRVLKGIFTAGSIIDLLRVWGPGLVAIVVAAGFLFPDGYWGYGIVSILTGIVWVAVAYTRLKFGARFVIYCGLIFAFIFAVSPLNKDTSYISFVKDARLFDTRTNGSVFGSLFDSEEWSCDRKAEKVEYTGVYDNEGYGDKETLRIVFSVDYDNGTYQVTQVYVNGTMMKEEQASNLLHALFQEDIEKELSLTALAHIAGVLYGEDYDYPGINFKDTFDAFFASGEWSYDGNDTVLFSGKYDDGEHVYDVIIEFQEENGAFTYEDIIVDGNVYGSYGAVQAIKEIFSSYDSGLTA